MNAQTRSSPSKLPSLGFVAVVLVHIGLGVFLIWGFTQPPLDRVWELSHALKTGKLGTLAARDRDLLRTTLARHPKLTDSLLSQEKIGIISANNRGWLETADATLIVSPNALAPCSMLIATRLGAEAFPLDVEVSGTGWRRQLVVPDAHGAEITFPETPPTADVVEVRLSGKTAAQGAVHLGFRCGKKGERG